MSNAQYLRDQFVQTNVLFYICDLSLEISFDFFGIHKDQSDHSIIITLFDFLHPNLVTSMYEPD